MKILIGFILIAVAFAIGELTFAFFTLIAFYFLGRLFTPLEKKRGAETTRESKIIIPERESRSEYDANRYLRS
jgi:hypothetical protein